MFENNKVGEAVGYGFGSISIILICAIVIVIASLSIYFENREFEKQIIQKNATIQVYEYEMDSTLEISIQEKVIPLLEKVDSLEGIIREYRGNKFQRESNRSDWGEEI